MKRKRVSNKVNNKSAATTKPTTGLLLTGNSPAETTKCEQRGNNPRHPLAPDSRIGMQAQRESWLLGWWAGMGGRKCPHITVPEHWHEANAEHCREAAALGWERGNSARTGQTEEVRLTAEVGQAGGAL
jgi:hypothetical protein